jgi:hydrogenase maturation protein HypF
VAAELHVERILDVQHHHAHIAAVAAEHGVTDPVVGVAYDGTGYGDDGRVWGAEILVADLQQYRRAAQLRYAPLPGGDLAVRLPWRAALGYLSLAPDAAPAFGAAFDGVPPHERRIAERQIERHLNTPLASSMGRLFDAAAAVLGLRTQVRYEGQAAMQLEALAGTHPGQPLPFPVARGKDETWIMDPVPLLVALGERRSRGDDAHALAAQFHESVARATTETVTAVCEDTNIQTVALGGGVFQNARLLSSVRRRLEAGGLRVLTPRQLSPNDGAISFGQVAVAAAILHLEGGS